jgi:hypothetical protein
MHRYKSTGERKPTLQEFDPVYLNTKLVSPWTFGIYFANIFPMSINFDTSNEYKVLQTRYL